MSYHQLHGYLQYVKCINDYVTDCIVTPDCSYFIRVLCTEMSQLFDMFVQYN